MEKITKKQACALVDAHEIQSMLENEEEAELLKENNPELFDAYVLLLDIAELNPTPEIPFFEGTMEALDNITIRK